MADPLSVNQQKALAMMAMRKRQEESSAPQPEKPDTVAQDVAKTAASVPERFGAGVAMALPNLVNTAVAGPQYLGRGIAENVDKLIGVEPQPRGKIWQPVYSSEEVLQKLPEPLRPHVPTTLAGEATDFAGNLLAQTAAGKSGKFMEGNPNTIKNIREDLKTSPSEKANAYIIKTLRKAGHSDDEIKDMMENAKKYGQTAGEASNNPALLGKERNISGMNRPGGETVRDFAKERVNPANLESVPAKLGSQAKTLVAKQDQASKEIAEAARRAPKYPVEMKALKADLTTDLGKISTNTPARSTIEKINTWVKEAQKKGGTFEAWHDVKQNIGGLYQEMKNPVALEKYDSHIVGKYYDRINAVLRGEESGLPEGLKSQGGKYAAANDKYSQHVAGEMIQRALKDMPTGGTPNAALNHLYKKLAGSPEAQEELFKGMPAADRAGMMNFLKAINQSGRAGVSDVVKSGAEGTPSFPHSMSSTVTAAKDWLLQKIQGKQYDEIAKALTSPDVKAIAKQMAPKGQSANQALGAATNPLGAIP